MSDIQRKRWLLLATGFSLVGTVLIVIAQSGPMDEPAQEQAPGDPALAAALVAVDRVVAVDSGAGVPGVVDRGAGVLGAVDRGVEAPGVEALGAEVPAAKVPGVVARGVEVPAAEAKGMEVAMVAAWGLCKSSKTDDGVAPGLWSEVVNKATAEEQPDYLPSHNGQSTRRGDRRGFWYWFSLEQRSTTGVSVHPGVPAGSRLFVLGLRGTLR